MASKSLISEQLRDVVRGCGMTRYRLSMETGIAESVLSRFINHGSGLSLANIDKLCECVGVRLTQDAKPKKPKPRKPRK